MGLNQETNISEYREDEYCSRVVFNPHYSKGTEVYYLYFPEFWKSSYMGGLVVRRK